MSTHPLTVTRVATTAPRLSIGAEYQLPRTTISTILALPNSKINLTVPPGKIVKILMKFLPKIRDGTAGGKSQIVRTPRRVNHVSAGKPDWIFLVRFESIIGRAITFK